MQQQQQQQEAAETNILVAFAKYVDADVEAKQWDICRKDQLKSLQRIAMPVSCLISPSVALLVTRAA